MFNGLWRYTVALRCLRIADVSLQLADHASTFSRRWHHLRRANGHRQGCSEYESNLSSYARAFTVSSSKRGSARLTSADHSPFSRATATSDLSAWQSARTFGHPLCTSKEPDPFLLHPPPPSGSPKCPPSALSCCLNRDVDGPISPCGICRQVLREFCPLDMPILLVPSNYSSATQTVSAAEATQKEGEDVLVLTSMGEVSSGGRRHCFNLDSDVKLQHASNEQRALTLWLADAATLVRPLQPRQAQPLEFDLDSDIATHLVPSSGFGVASRAEPRRARSRVEKQGARNRNSGSKEGVC